ncbi:VCBS domain-containing protein [Pseudomonas farris]
MATTTTTSGGTVTSLSNTPQAQDDIFTTGVIGTSTAAITEDLLGVVYLDVMSNDLGGSAKTLWSLDDATSLSTATKIYAPADLLIQDTGRIEATSTDTSFNGAKIWITSDGKVGYDAATLSTAFKAQLQSLAAGASLTDSFTYAIRLGNGTLSWATAQVQFAGMNDSVTMSIGVQAGTVTEDATTTPSPADSLSTSGTIAFSDVDLSDTHTASFVAAGGNATALGNFTLASVTEAANAADGTVNWAYTLNNAAAQYLAQGQTVTETYVVTINDGHGSSTTQNVTISITGTNDQVQITSSVQAGDAGEDSGDYAASGSITFTDVDLIDTHSVTVTPGASGYLGSFTTDPLSDSTGTGNGSLGWNFAVNNTALQFLGEGQIVTQTYNVAIGDGAVQTVTITITGINDQVQITSGVQAGDAVEDSGDYAASGSITFTDVDLIDTHSVTVTPGASGYLGSFTTDPLSDSTGTGSGSLGWNFAVNNSALQFLGEGQIVTQTYNVAIGDGAVQTVTITITGDNDQVQITSGVQAGDSGEDSGDYAASGNITFTDVDLIDTHSVTVTPGASGYLGSFTTNPLSDSTGTGNGSLGWNFAVNNTALQFLGEAQSVTQTYNVAIGDGAVQTVTITITGDNDQVQITSGVQAGDAKEDSGDYAASGCVTFTDVDLIDIHSVSITPGASGYLGSFTTNPLSDSTGTGSGSLGWNFAVNNTALQFLGEGQIVTQTYNVAIGDGAVQTVTITITGTNDQPTLTITDTTGAMNEGNATATLSDSGALSFADLDSTDTVTVSQTTNGDIAWSGGVLNATVASALVAGFSVDQNSWDYSSNQNLDFLGAGETITFSYAVVATDDSGAANAASATQTVTITITGTNDAPVLSFATGNDAGAVQEDTALTVSGQFSSADIDHAATASWSIAGTNTGIYGSIAVDSTGKWTYTLANGTDGVASAVQSLGAGESHDEVFTVQVSDGLGGVDTQLVTVTVTGSNDAPVLSFVTGNDAGAVQEDTALSVSGQFSSADIDHAATATWSIAGTNTGTYGSIAVDSTGKWTYTLANGTDGVASAVQSLAAGESHDEVFSVQVSDGLGGVDTQLVTVTVTGTNDAAVLSSANVTLTETNAPLTTNGTLTISDVDSAATFVAQPGTAGSFGQFSIGTNGAWTYVANNAHNEFVAGTTYTDTFAVSSADGTLTSVTVHILGTNDAAVLSADIANLTETNAAIDISTTGTLTISDVDSATTFVAQSNTAGSYGQFSIGTNGAWTYVADSAHNEFAAGTTYTDTFSVSSADGTLTSVTVHILGTNDAAVLSADSANLTETNAPLTTNGTLTISDVDSAATFVAQPGTAGSFGQFSIGTDGAWSYVANSAHNEFVAGTTYTDTFAVSSADGTFTSVTVHILGTNDAAVLSADIANLTETNAPLSTNGTLTISDVDSAATFVAQPNTAGSYGQFSIGTNGAWSYVADSAHNEFVAGTTYTDSFAVSSADGTLTSVTVHILGSNDAAVLSSASITLTETDAVTDISTSGTLTISDVDSAATFVAQSNTVGSYGQFSIGTDGAWSYVANSAHNEFVAGTTYTDTFAVSSADGTFTSVTVHILGTNDAAVLSADIANLTETNAPLTTNGTLTISDVDSAATFVTQTNTAGSYGQFSIGTNGAWSYVADSAHNEFVAGTTYTDTFAVSSADGTLTSVTVHILGTNDAAVLSADIANLTETNAPLTTNGTLIISDVDSTATFIAQPGTAGSYGQFSIGTNGAWSYVANNAHNEFVAGTTYTDTFAVSSADGTLTSVTVHILGTNDAAVLSADIANLTETNAPLTTAGTLTISDVDNPETFQAQSGTAGTNGTFAINTAGNWSYTANSAFDSLNVGDSLTDTFTVLSADGTATAVTVTINGTNDAAVLSSASVTLTETNAPLTTAGTLTISDIDSPETFQAQSGTAGANGTFAINTAGNWSYTANSAFDALNAGDSLTDTFTVLSADGTATSVTVTINGSNDSPTITSNGGGATASVSVVENTTTVTTVVASDADLPAQTLSYSIVGGADAAKFSIVSGTGALSFISAPNFEAPTDSGTNNVYDVIVRASDGTLFDDQSIAVTVTGVNDNTPTITSNGGGATASVSVAENTTVVTTVAATDADLPAQTLSYSIVGGADAAKFSIVSGTGALSFVSAPNFEAPTDSGTNNVYDVIVRASDGTLFDDQALAVSVTGVNDNSPVITSNGGGATASVNVAENTTAVTTVTATDADLPAQTLSYSILNTAGTDFSKFSISSSGVLTFNSAPDYENAQDVGGADGDNAYVVDVLVADGNGGTDTQTITVNVQNVVETPVDTVAPTVTSITAATTSGTPLGNTGSGKITITFSEAVSNFDIDDLSITADRGTLSNFSGSGNTYTVDFTRTNNGSVKVSVANTYTDLAGNTGVAFGPSTNLPAGVAGEPINLALNIPLAEISSLITVTIGGVPSGWTFSAGTDNGDGTWTVQTSDPGSLTVTTPADFAGALVLDVNMTWTNADGSIGNAFVFDNVEAYAPGSPIFALSADDNLTGSSGADLFVFAQPIGNNVIHSFDAAADKIDLIGFTGIAGFADLSITNDANGNALVSISSGQSVTLKGVDAANLSEANFQFDVDPVMTNTGTLTIADGAIMPFGGSIHNSGTIELGSTGSETNLEILFRGATLTGGGQVQLSDSAQNVIFGGSADTVLTNVDNRISGAGQLGAGQMVLVNAGLILASGLNSLVLDTGTHTITNSGVLESTGEGGMTVVSAVDNSGHLWANGGDMRLLADVMGNGSATIDGDATLTFSGAAHGSVAFHGEGAGTLVIAQAEAAGSLVGILGLESDDMLTFGDLAFGANTQLTYSTNASGAGGLLTVDDGVHRAEVNLLGHYTVDDFQATDGGEAGTQISYNGASSGTLVGSMAADVLSGGDGNDILAGRGGEDTLSGGAGADMFAYLNVAEGGDTILDYNFAEGDALDLSALLSANFVSGVSQASDFVQLAQSGNDITVKVDADGAANGTNFADVAVLANTGTSGTDLVRTWFGEADHTLTA